tara:strand:- start:376 stop:1281 length:906 start_codon:yes stop_codon:yes gene_type:complete
MNYKVIFLGLLLSMLACDDNEALIKPTAYQLQTGSGSFIYNQFEPFSSKPIEVFYHIPENVDNTLPILISLHGADRNGNNHRNTLVNKSNQFKFIVIAPQFTVNYFPGGDTYNLANIFIDGDNPSVTSLNPENQWTFSVLDPIFNYIKSITNNNSAKYNLIGFSAGGQLAHRTFLFGNSISCNKTIAMSSGWYTTINNNIDFPYGLNYSPLQTSDLSNVFAKELIILVGENDNNPNAAGLRRNSTVDLQGTNRLDRANYFYSLAESMASEQDIPFNWEIAIIPNASHELSPISNYAINLLY